MQPTVWSSKQPHVTCMHAVHQESWRRRQTNSIESRPRAFNQSTGISSEIRTTLRDWAAWQAGPAATLRQHYPQMTQRRCTKKEYQANPKFSYRMVSLMRRFSRLHNCRLALYTSLAKSLLASTKFLIRVLSKPRMKQSRISTH